MKKLVSGRHWSWAAIAMALAGVGAALVLAVGPPGATGRGSRAPAHPSPPARHRLLLPRVVQQPQLSPREARSYRPTPVPSGFALRNVRQHLRARFGISGVAVRSGASLLGLRLTGYGYGTPLDHIASVRPQSAGSQIVFRHPGLSEWWGNAPDGLEQSFTLATPRPRGATGDLLLTLRLSGNVHGKLLPGAGAVIFGAGRSALLYHHLRATDALGHELRARMQLSNHRLLLRINDRAARYPLRIDPTLQSDSSLDAYGQAVVADQPDVYLRLDEATGGIAHDSSGNANDGTYANGVTHGSQGALVSDTNDAAVTMPAFGWWITQSGSTLPSGNGARTLEFWVRTSDAGGLPTFQYGGSGTGTNDQFRVQLEQNNGTSYLWLAKDGSQPESSGQYAVALPRAWWDGNWHMFDVTYDGAHALAYMDGQVAGDFAIDAPLATTTPGSANPGDGMLIGQRATNSPVGIDEAAVYPTALSPQRIDAHWSAGGSPDGAACAANAHDAYGQSVVADAPAMYLRLGDLVTSSSDRVAYDSSGQCTAAAPTNAAFMSGATAQPSGALVGDSAGALRMPAFGWWVTQSGATLPSGNANRTLEFWVRTSDAGGLPTFQYGGSGSGTSDQFRVQLVQSNGGSFLSLTTDSSHSSTVSLPRAWWDGNWHLYDVTYDGTQALAYMDGQVAGSFAIPKSLATATPGTGMLIGQLSTNSPVDVQEASVYPAALSPQRIDAHWTAGGSSAGACAPSTTAPYAQTVVSDSPALYLRLGDLSSSGSDRVAYDSSGHCTTAAPINGAYMSGAAAQPDGALAGDNAAALRMPSFGWWVTQSGATLPAANTARTIEFWVRTSDAGGLPTFQYGGSGSGTGDQFRVQLVQSNGGSFLSLTTDSSHSSTVTLPRAWWDGNWHLFDVSFDGSHALGYMDGQAAGSFALSTPLATVTPGDGMMIGQLATNSPVDVQEAAVYPAALAPQRITAHWEAQYLTPAGTSLIAGSATFGDGSAAQGARIQACPTSGAACVIDPNPVSGSGSFHMLIPNDTYTITIFPPPGSASGAKTIGPLTVPPSTQNLSAVFSPPGGLPSGVTFSSPSTGTQQNNVPRVNWGEPSTLTVNGCKGGFGIVFIHATNTSTGQSETLSAQLVETPAGSGSYVAQIPPLAPLHGQGDLDPQITCPGTTSVLPDGGPQSGATTVLLSGNGFTGASAVSFGGTPASSYKVISDRLIQAVSPAGTGTVGITVTTSSGATVNVGNYNYFDVTSISPSAGSSTGGTTVTIHGDGFNAVSAVMFGLLPSPSVTLVNSGEIQATAPPGLGTVNVEVINGFASSKQGVQYTFQNGPAGSSNISEPTSGGDNATSSLASQISSYCASNDCGGAYAPVSSAATEYNTPPPASSDDADVARNDRINWGNFGIGALMAACAPILGADVACAVAGVGALIGSTVFGFLDNHKICLLGFLGHCGVNIDPSGTVVDTNNNPISGATATILQEDPGGGFTPVDPSSGVIVPNVNPQTTGSTGAFDWDALAGTYEVQASASGCHAPGDAGHPDVSTPAFTLPPPAIGLLLTLECPGNTPAPPTPAVSGVTPGGGMTSGGNTVDIAGTGLAGATGVQFGNQPATNFKVLSPYAVQATAPAGSGAVDITVSTPGGTSATGDADRYVYVEPASPAATAPTITSIAPAAGPTSGGTTVTINGTNLDGTYGVAFGGAPATAITAVSPTQVKAVSPSAAIPKRVDIAVTTPNGTSASTAGDIFTYGAPPPPPVPTVNVAASPSPANFHQAVALTATVSPIDGGGTVAFYDGGAATPISGCGAMPLTATSGGYKATCSTSTLSPGDHNITGAYSGDPSYSSASGAGAVSIVGAPVNTSPPAISGATTENQTLTETHGSWRFNPTSYGYQWEQCDIAGNGCSPISGATGSAYTLTAGNVGHTLRVQETATNAVGTSDPATSAPSGVVQSSGGPRSKPANNSRPDIPGPATAGRSLLLSAGTWSGTPPISYAYQWQLCKPGCSDIPGATGAAYTPTTSQIGGGIRAVVTATNALGSASAISNQVAPVQPSAGQVGAALGGVLAPKGKNARIGTLLKTGGYAFAFGAPSGGTLVISWYYVPPGAHLTKKKALKPTLIGQAVASVARRGTVAARVRLTAAGRAALRHAGALPLVSKVSFTPTGGVRAVKTRAFTLRR